MEKRDIIGSFFFSNYFLGILAVALSLETSFQLALPFNSLPWHSLLFSGVVMYYTYAYISAGHHSFAENPRTRWYQLHRKAVKTSQVLLAMAFLCSALVYFLRHCSSLGSLHWSSWAILLGTLLAAASYYGKLPFLNLRNSGWTKPVTIGLCWAASVSLLPLVSLQLENDGSVEIPWLLAAWLFVKNWMFCSVNAILFDIKDYADDSNRELKTFVVRYGTRFTIMFILLPMILLGVVSFLLFSYYRNLNIHQVAVNLVPFALTLYIALSMHKPRPILYYLVVIDGMLLVKAICGITATLMQ
ncbi:MAG: hypothetical protein ABS46_03495 [Cytophagaceae bacterium SCN 52-12]|nr:MAG: hypothetical protein ABS46_03495 [Cytophagaceae bacterium SCN 52-12]